MSRTRLLTGGIVGLLLAATAQGSPLTFLDDYEGFVEAAPTEVQVIDFETLPDGSPSWTPAPITPEFNYTHLGATFLPHRDPGLYIYGNPTGGFLLTADSYPSFERNWIIAEFSRPASAVGTWQLGDRTLSAYGAGGELLESVYYGYAGEHFIGIVSDVPIAYATIDHGDWLASSREFVFADFPEPSTGLSVLVMSTFVLVRRRRATQ